MTQKPELEIQEAVSPGVLKLGASMIMLTGLLIVAIGWRLTVVLWLLVVSLAALFLLFMIVWYRLKYGNWIWR